jgi:hypothetical protein
MKSSIICAPHPLYGLIKSRSHRQASEWGTYEAEENTKFWWGNLKARDHLKDLGTDGIIISKYISNKYNWRMWSGFFWLRTETSGGAVVNMVMNPQVS